MTKQHLVVLTGAGISADSGVDTYRDSGGLWEGHRFEEVATPEGWRRDPQLVWRFYQQRRAQVCGVEPNAAHHALADLGARLAQAGGSLLLVTQNVDDLHQRAGSEVLAMHGELLRLRCTACDARPVNRTDFDTDVFLACPDCGHRPLRPDVVWFGEMPYHLEAIERGLQRATTFVAIGTSGAVYPAAGYLAYAREAGIPTIVQGLAEPDNLWPEDRYVPGRASEAVPALCAELLS